MSCESSKKINFGSSRPTNKSAKLEEVERKTTNKQSTCRRLHNDKYFHCNADVTASQVLLVTFPPVSLIEALAMGDLVCLSSAVSSV